MLESLKSQYETYLNKHPFAGEPSRLYDSMNYIMQLGGKRIRPILTLIGAEIAGGNSSIALPVAHAVEVFHNFTLVHDDIMDQAPTRRNQTTLHLKEDTPTAILAGDNMMIAAYDIILKSDLKLKSQILETLSQAAREICEGQQFDMDFEKLQSVELNEYIEMIRLKTAVLLGCSLKCGALSAEANQDLCNALYDFGMFAGIGFQIMDDYLDAYGNPALTGKQPGGDLLAAKKTALFILAYNKANQSEKKQLLEWFDIQFDPHERRKLTLDLFNLYHIEEHCKHLMQTYFAKAKQAIQQVDLTPTQMKPLDDLLHFLGVRTW